MDCFEFQESGEILNISYLTWLGDTVAFLLESSLGVKFQCFTNIVEKIEEN